jgi:chromosome partitioning protein
MLTINALAAADSVIIPVQAQYLPAKGMTQLLKTILRVQKHINPNLTIDGALLTMYDARENLSRETEALLRQQFGNVLRVYQTQIPRSTQAAQACIVGESVYTYAPRTKVAKVYHQFVEEMLQNG